eukprot:TRINITY_DN36853_c0_g1_i1.p1 TRINITY_DN36853_c0_g1~~TRINITY_DN36853_c0_g1_i1.p1  ORF type:complete len:730 (-),score=109.31 TRINITY_DN36853_c0_g1_i1:185-2374(-)
MRSTALLIYGAALLATVGLWSVRADDDLEQLVTLVSSACGIEGVQGEADAVLLVKDFFNQDVMKGVHDVDEFMEKIKSDVSRVYREASALKHELRNVLSEHDDLLKKRIHELGQILGDLGNTVGHKLTEKVPCLRVVENAFADVLGRLEEFAGSCFDKFECGLGWTVGRDCSFGDWLDWSSCTGTAGSKRRWRQRGFLLHNGGGWCHKADLKPILDLKDCASLGDDDDDETADLVREDAKWLPREDRKEFLKGVSDDVQDLEDVVEKEDKDDTDRDSGPTFSWSMWMANMGNIVMPASTEALLEPMQEAGRPVASSFDELVGMFEVGVQKLRTYDDAQNGGRPYTLEAVPDLSVQPATLKELVQLVKIPPSVAPLQHRFLVERGQLGPLGFKEDTAQSCSKHCDSTPQLKLSEPTDVVNEAFGKWQASWTKCVRNGNFVVIKDHGFVSIPHLRSLEFTKHQRLFTPKRMHMDFTIAKTWIVGFDKLMAAYQNQSHSSVKREQWDWYLHKFLIVLAAEGVEHVKDAKVDLVLQEIGLATAPHLVQDALQKAFDSIIDRGSSAQQQPTIINNTQVWTDVRADGNIGVNQGASDLQVQMKKCEGSGNGGHAGETGTVCCEADAGAVCCSAAAASNGKVDADSQKYCSQKDTHMHFQGKVSACSGSSPATMKKYENAIGLPDRSDALVFSPASAGLGFLVGAFVVAVAQRCRSSSGVDSLEALQQDRMLYTAE